MRPYNKRWFVIFMIGWMALFASNAISQTRLDFSVGIGRSIVVQHTNLTIEFRAVLEDSRCPVDALCTMAGNARVELVVTEHSGQKQTVVLNTDEEPKAVNVFAYKLILRSLMPQRTADKALSISDYSVSLRLEKLIDD